MQQGGLFYGYAKKDAKGSTVPHGPGVMVYQRGMKYFGTFKDGKRDGFGRVEFVKLEKRKSRGQKDED